MAFTVTVTPTPLETIAGWVQYSRQLAADAPALRSLLNTEMPRDVLRKLESEVAGVVDAATLPDTTGASGDPLIQVIREGIATVETAGYSPSVLLGSPADLAALDIAVLNLGGSSAAIMGSSFWGLRPVPVPGFTKTIVADAASAFTLFVRSGVEMYTTDSDITGAGATAASAFRANILTTLAEMRAKGAVTNAAAATEIILTP